jgi:hypothetical protein
MKRFSVIVAALAICAASCSKDNNPVTAADDTHPSFKATLSAANERPNPIAGAESTAAGVATIDFTLTKDSAGAITAATVNFRVDVTGLTPTSAITLSHIHTGDANTAGPVLVTANVNPGEITLTNGAVTYSRLNVPVTPVSNAQAIINNPAGFYFNVHTAANPAGVMRGQLVKQ